MLHFRVFIRTHNWRATLRSELVDRSRVDHDLPVTAGSAQ